MGFGILFFGYFLTFLGGITPIAAFTYVLGSAIMLLALYKLSEQNKLFATSCVMSFLLFLISFAIMLMYVFNYTSAIAYNILILLQTLLSIAFNVILMLAIFAISKEVELTRIQVNSAINIFFISISGIVNIVSMFFDNEDVLARLGMVYFVSQILYTVFALIIIFKCYMKICYEEDRDMSQASGGVPIFDFLNRLFDKATHKNDKGNKGGK